mmetsp:Transcript_4704/g.17086  ORF Transcript_4704/g.17086 Transcript_4704/m.17086 type:complete len:202 (+) Transcript_4704:218-823(+)
MMRRAAALLLVVQLSAAWKCIPENSPDFGTCAGLDKECCEQWLLECDLQCSSMVQPPVSINTQEVRNFSCKDLELKYRCQCEGSDCPNTYCASSQCYSVASGDECSAPCSPKVTEPNCPQGTFAVFKKSYPFCPQNSVRFSCEHFDRCEPYGGEGVHTLELKGGTSQGPDKRLLSRKNGASTQRGSGLLLMVMTFICYLAI